MKITFVSLGAEQLGISQLSSIIQAKGHQVGLAFSASLFNDRFNLEIPSIAQFFNDTQNVYDAIQKQHPDIIAFSPLTSTYQWCLQVAQNTKSMYPEIKTIFGGVHASAVPHLLLEEAAIDYVVVGEGDEAFPAIIEAIEKQDYATPILNTQYKNPKGNIIKGIQTGFYQSLDTLPFYDKKLWEEHIVYKDLYMTMASRGCPYRCTFCFNNFFAMLPENKKTKGKYVRLRSPQHVIAELKQAKQRYNMRRIDFQDDVFTTDKKWLQEFLYLYKKEIHLPFQILTHPRYMDNDIAKWLSEAGCIWIQMGVQSMDDNFRNDSLMRYEKSDDIEKALKAMHQYSMHVKVDHMFGLPNEPLEAQEKAHKLYADETPARIQTFWTCYLPGTQMMNEAVANGTLTSEQAEKINKGLDFYFYRNTDNIKDEVKLKMYQHYEFIFKLMPLVPKKYRASFTPQVVEKIPTSVLMMIAFIADIIVGFSSKNPDFIWYGNHYKFLLKKHFLQKFNIHIKANKVNNKPSEDNGFININTITKEEKITEEVVS